MSRRHDEVMAAAAQLAEHIDSHGCATRVLPRGLPACKRAARLDVLTASVAELRRTRHDVHALTISGERLELGEICELLFVAWQGNERPVLFDDEDEDGGQR